MQARFALVGMMLAVGCGSSGGHTAADLTSAQDDQVTKLQQQVALLEQRLSTAESGLAAAQQAMATLPSLRAHVDDVDQAHTAAETQLNAAALQAQDSAQRALDLGGAVEAQLGTVTGRVATIEAQQLDGRLASLEGASLPTRMSAVETTASSMDVRTKVVEARTASMSAMTINGYPSLVFNGVNVHIRNGSGSTTSNNGVGNLILGYDEVSTGQPEKVASHSLITGFGNTYKGYGLVMSGQFNRVAGNYAAVVAGDGDTTEAALSALIAGIANKVTATGSHGTIFGGQWNVNSGNQDILVGTNSRTTTGNGQLWVGSTLNP